MSANMTWEHILKKVLEAIKPQEEDRVTRSQVIDELRGVIESVETLKGRWNMVQLVPERVPILKCESSHNGFSCDISIDNLKGQMKSKLLLWISEIDGRFRDMVLLVKEWAKEHGINDSTSETFNSYSLTLLVIFHFQIEDPFEQPENSTMAVSMSGLTKISEAFGMSHSRLISADQNEDSLLATLVRRQVSQSIARACIKNPTYKGKGYRNVHLPSKTWHQYPKRWSNNSTRTETVQAHHNQKHGREGSLHGANVEVPSPLRSQSVTLGPTNRVALSNPARDLRTVSSANIEKCGGNRTYVSSPADTEGLSAPKSSEVALVPNVGTEGSENGLELSELPQSKEDLHQSSPPSVLDGSIDDTLYDQLEQAMEEARNARLEAFQETIKRGKAEKDSIDAIRRAKASENSYVEALKQRKEIEEALAKEKEELEKMKNQCDEVKEELQIALDQKSSLERQALTQRKENEEALAKEKKELEKMKNQLDKVVEELQIALDQKSSLERQFAVSEQMVKELEQKIISAVELLETYEKEKDELQTERDNALEEAEELRKKQEEASSTNTPHLQGPSEFQQEVDVLSKLRHPNLVTLIGACPEAWALVYEYLPNGSLEDRLSCKDSSAPLSWQIRIRIAAELCSALILIHSCKPNSIIHGDLKPSNILLDANFVSKLSDFGICRLLSNDQSSNINSTLCWKTNPKGTFAYMDPEFLSTAELTPKSDVYSFGIILLQLLTGRPALGITKEVQYALDGGNLKALLDPLAGDWPFVQAEQLANLALRCCEMNRRNRPDLRSDVWRVLEPMRASCGGSSSFRLGSEEHFQPPSYFICPIFHEVMQDPHVAADGFTYEAEALRGWLDSGHDTSPMTNVKLEHCNLVPNHSLRSAIREWQQQH
uniref:RING-type E3 ubiquitin transferase n=1 Tax=Fagus sylvatica TaxID=28930 RepID=A0A2N9FE11_FAGSY